MPAKRLSKSQFLTELAEKSGLSKKQAASALDALSTIVAHQLGKRGPGDVIVPGLVRLIVVEKPATPQHEGINPFTKAPMMYKARPARKVIRVRPVKGLKDAI